MNYLYILNIELGEYNAPIQIQEESTEVSPHTGRDLRVLRGELNATGEDMHDMFTQALSEQGSDGVWSHEHPSVPKGRWVIARGNYSITDDRYRYQVTIREVENLEIEALILDGVEVKPYRYDEEAHKGEIRTIKAMVRVKGEQIDRLASLVREGGYFPVIRRGINEAPLEARFGMCGWSQHEGDRKYALILVPRGRDESENHGLMIGHEERFNRHDEAAFRSELMEEMLSLLVEKGLLTDAEIQSARKRAEARIPERRQQYMQVNDADELDW